MNSEEQVLAEPSPRHDVVSFVVPTKNSAATLAACLRSIRAQQDALVEIVVIDNFSSDGTHEIASELADVAVQAGPERSAQRNLGARLSTGALVAFIDSDMVLEPRVAEDALRQFQDPEVGALVIPERAFGSGFLAKCRSLEKELYLGDASVEAARVFRRAVFQESGGYDESLTGAEDWELPDRIHARGWTIGRTQAEVWHDEGTVRLVSCFNKKRYYGRGVAEYHGRDRSTATRPVSRRSLMSLEALRKSPLTYLGLAVLKTVEAAGILVGVLEQRLFRGRQAATHS